MRGVAAGEVRAVAALSPVAPFDGADWFAGMGPTSAAALGAATRGRRAREEIAGGEADFTAADWAAFGGPGRYLVVVP